jgi:hypothetical protein
VRRHLALLAAVLVSFALSADRVSAEPPFFATCGRIDALSLPTASAPGSITLGGNTFAITVRDRIPQAPLVGTVGCLNQTVTTSGPVLVLLGMPSPFCGQVMGVLEPVAGARPAAIDIFSPPTLRTVLLAAPGLQLSGRSGVAGCFETGIDSAGRATAVRALTASAQHTITSLPLTSTAAGARAP